MELQLKLQAVALILALLLGLALGLLYDLLRPLRQRFPGGAALIMDGAFALISAGALFCHAMAAGEGRLGQWELLAALAGFLLYLHLLSPLLLPKFNNVLLFFEKCVAACRFLTKKFAAGAKKIFQKLNQCIIIRKEKNN